MGRKKEPKANMKVNCFYCVSRSEDRRSCTNPKGIGFGTIFQIYCKKFKDTRKKKHRVTV